MDMNLRIMQYERMIYKHLIALCIKYDQDDFLQIGRMAVFKALQIADADDSIVEASLVYGLIRNRLIDEIRRRQKYRMEVLDADTVIEPIDKNNMKYQEWMLVLNEVLNTMEYNCLILTLEGHTQSEIAILIKRSPSMVKQYRRNIRAKVARYVSQ